MFEIDNVSIKNLLSDTNMLFRRRKGFITPLIFGLILLWLVYTFMVPKPSDKDESRKDIEKVEDRNKLLNFMPHRVEQGLNVNQNVRGKDIIDEEHAVLADLLDGVHKQDGGKLEQDGVHKQDGGRLEQDGVHEEDNAAQEERKAAEEHEVEQKKEEPQMQIDLPSNKDKPGEGGKPVHINKDKLSPEERKQYDLGWKNNAYNEYASDKISLHRSLDDNRDQICKTLKYRPLEELPSTSVIVIFHNEGWSVLLRTVHSVIDRSPPEILKEVILVDDFSTMDHLQKPLDDYVAGLSNVKLLRAQRREGLIRARLMGAAQAEGEVLVFLDSHCEAAPGWLEPLADRIADNWSNVLTPIIEVINDETMEYKTSRVRDVQVGGFNWNLIFTWHVVPKEDLLNRSSAGAPIRSPTMAGGLFAISRKYFEYIGTYDPGMEIWGGENLELSFRVWMCGGVLETIPCSHVGHIFRKRSPYSWKSSVGGNVLQRNNVRLAEVWLDEYKEYYYEKIGHRLGEYGDISSRQKLREKLHCKSFDWFLKTIYPTLFVPRDSIAKGEIRSYADSKCIDSAVGKSNMEKPVQMWPCHEQGGNQFWMLSKTGEIRRDETCLDFSSGGKSVITYECHGSKGNQEWIYNENDTLMHLVSHLCMALSDDNKQLHMSPCDPSNQRQKWKWKRNTNREL